MLVLFVLFLYRQWADEKYFVNTEKNPQLQVHDRLNYVISCLQLKGQLIRSSVLYTYKYNLFCMAVEFKS